MDGLTFVQASNTYKLDYLEKPIQEREHRLFRKIGGQLMNIMLYQVIDRMQTVELQSQPAQYVLANIYNAILDKESLSETDVKLLLGMLYTKPNHEIHQKLDRKLEEYVAVLIEKFAEEGNSSKILTESIINGNNDSIMSEFSNINGEPFLKMEPEDEQRNISSLNNSSQKYAEMSRGMNKAEHSFKLEQPPRDANQEVENYVKSLANPKVELNNFYQQMKLIPPVFDKERDGLNWRASCLVHTKNNLFDEYQRQEYLTYDVQSNSKIAEVGAARKLLVQLFSENLKLFEKFREIKRRLKLE